MVAVACCSPSIALSSGRWLETVVNEQIIWVWNLKADEPSAEGQEVARCEVSWKFLRGRPQHPMARDPR